MKTRITILAEEKDAEDFKKIQKEYKKKGFSVQVLFKEIMEIWREVKGE